MGIRQLPQEYHIREIGGGSEPRDIEWQSIIAITKHIRQKSPKPIYLMSLPPKDLSVLEQYHQNGITEIGFNIELFDVENAIKYMPGKGEIEREDYFEAWEKATKYWGTNGKVRSLIILGLKKRYLIVRYPAIMFYRSYAYSICVSTNSGNCYGECCSSLKSLFKKYLLCRNGNLY